MTTANNVVIIQQIKDLATAVSTQAQVSNRIWLGLVTIAVISLLPQDPNTIDVPLPFGLGKVPSTWFYPVLFSLMIVLTIAFASAHAQLVRAQKLAQRFVDSFGDYAEFAGMHPRELFDMFRLPSLNRVAPVAQSIRGKYQFYSHKAKCPTFLIAAGTVSYALLKVISMTVYFGVPAFALLRTYGKIPAVPLGWRLMICFGGLVATATLLLAFIWDLLYSIAVAKKISSKS
jgi:hypothetical protein